MLAYRISQLAAAIANKENFNQAIVEKELNWMSISQIEYLEDKYEVELIYIFNNSPLKR